MQFGSKKILFLLVFCVGFMRPQRLRPLVVMLPWFACWLCSFWLVQVGNAHLHSHMGLLCVDLLLQYVIYIVCTQLCWEEDKILHTGTRLAIGGNSQNQTIPYLCGVQQLVCSAWGLKIVEKETTFAPQLNHATNCFFHTKVTRQMVSIPFHFIWCCWYQRFKSPLNSEDGIVVVSLFQN